MLSPIISNLIKDLTPPALLRIVKGRFYGWSGDYASWADAQKYSDGYDRDFILETVRNATRRVISGSARYERDGVAFDDAGYNFELLAALSFVNKNDSMPAHVIDFGGSLGSLYRQHQHFLLPQLIATWNVVEQEHFVKAGLNEFAGNQLNFYYTIDSCMKAVPVNVMVLSSVLQYLPDSFGFLDKIIEYNIKWLFIDRTAFSESATDRITIQKVHPSIYKASYPCRFLSESRFKEKLFNHYVMLFEFDSLDRSNLKNTSFKGMFLRLKK